MTTPSFDRQRSWTPTTQLRRIATPRSKRTSWAARGVTALALVAAQLAVAPPLRAAATWPVGDVATRPAASAEAADGLVLRYKLDESSGTVAADASGNHRDGTVSGNADWTPGKGLGFNGSTTQVKAPDDVLKGLQSVSVAMDVLIHPDLQGDYFIYGFGNTAANGDGNGYLFADGNDLRTTISTGNWTAEQNTRPSAPHNLARDTFKHVTYTQTGNTGVLYEDGVEVGRNTAVTIKPGDIGGGHTTANYLGRSLYSKDARFKGRIRDFQVYDRALTATEVRQLAADTVTQGVAQDKAALTLGDTDAVSDDLSLPAPGTFGSTITYASSDTAVLGNDGKVTRPGRGRPDATVTLTATLRRGAASDTKVFTVKVLAEFDDSTKVDEAKQALSLPHIDDVRGNLTLPDKGINGTTVTWTSSRPSVIGIDGVVHRPSHGQDSVRVNLIATVRLNQVESSRKFQATVRPLPAKQALKGYLFSYFTGESRANGEQIYLALSKGNDPLKFRELNNNQPVLTSTIGDKGVRDPFIIRSPEGDKFYQIATDLRIFGNGNWDASQRTGSKSIMVWESTDLVNWTDQRLVKVSPDTAGNTWAPEAFYDRTLGAYVVFWASKIYATSDPNHTGNTHERIMYATTRDFRTFSEAKPYIEQNSQGQTGKSIIDTTMIEHNGSFYRYTKDEEDSSKYAKMVFQQKGDGVLGTWRNIGTDGTPLPRSSTGGRLFAAEGPTAFKSNTEDKWYLLLDDFGGGGYKPFVSTDLDSGVWTPATGAELPSSPRHGTVLPVTQAEYNRILRTYLPGELVDRIDEVKVRTPVGTAPVLPASLKATFADGSTTQAAVTWDHIAPRKYAKPGTFIVKGSIAQSSTVRAKAEVTVFVPDAADAGDPVTGAEGAAIALKGTAAGDSGRSWTSRAISDVDSGGSCVFADEHAATTTLTCTDDGTYELTLEVGKAIDTTTVTVTNARPVVGTVQTTDAEVDRQLTLKATARDPGANDSLTCVVDWRDGSTASKATIADGTCTATHTYHTAGTYDPVVTVTDDDEASTTSTGHVAVSPVRSASAGKDIDGVEGATLRLDGVVTGDGKPTWTVRPGTGVDPGGSCAFADEHAATTTLTCTDDGTYELTLTMGEHSDTATVKVTNAVPTIGDVTLPSATELRQAVTAQVPFADPGANDTHTCTVDWKDGNIQTGTTAGGVCTASHTYAAVGTYHVTVTVVDDDRGTATVRRDITVTPASAANAGADLRGGEGAAVALAGTATGAKTPEWSYRAVSGADTGATCSFVDVHAARTSVTCTDDGTYELRLTSGTASDTARLVLTNAAPALGKVTTAPAPATVDKAVKLTALFTDAGRHDEHTCVVDWHGARSNGTVTDGRCTASHTYPTAGGYDVTVTITDDDGGAVTRTVHVTVKAPTNGIAGPLARTGAPVITMAVIGGALLLGGALLFLLTLRRNRPARRS